MSRRPGPSRTRPTLLVVDDEAAVLHSVHDLLRVDYRVIARGSGAEALEVLEGPGEVHVVMSDQRMPGMSGVEVLRHARRLKPDATRLLFTAHADIRAVVDAINQGHVFRYLAKPCDPEELEAVVRQAVEQHDLLAENARLMAELRETNARPGRGGPAQGGVPRGRQPRAEHPGGGRPGDGRALEDVEAGRVRLGRGARLGRSHPGGRQAARRDRRADAQAGPGRRLRPHPRPPADPPGAPGPRGRVRPRPLPRRARAAGRAGPRPGPRHGPTSTRPSWPTS